ncbi:MAG: hypothetical protein RLZZ401_2065, partial [Pseudomonadota bacterium]
MEGCIQMAQPQSFWVVMVAQLLVKRLIGQPQMPAQLRLKASADGVCLKVGNRQQAPYL